jgi:hypothetical protein
MYSVITTVLYIPLPSRMGRFQISFIDQRIERLEVELYFVLEIRCTYSSISTIFLSRYSSCRIICNDSQTRDLRIIGIIFLHLKTQPCHERSFRSQRLQTGSNMETISPSTSQ